MLDDTDLKIINALIDDGRKSLRRIAREVGISTPTAKRRFEKLLSSGVIKGIIPILDSKIISSNINLIITLKGSQTMLNELKKIDEIRSIYLTTGEKNIMLRVTVKHNQLNQLLSKIGRITGVMDINTQLITDIVKEEQLGMIDIKSIINVKCEYCKKETDQPLLVDIKGHKLYFCCTSCITLYKDSYK